MTSDGAWRGMVTIIERMDTRPYIFDPPISEVVVTVNVYERLSIRATQARSKSPFEPPSRCVVGEHYLSVPTRCHRSSPRCAACERSGHTPAHRHSSVRPSTRGVHSSTSRLHVSTCRASASAAKAAAAASRHQVQRVLFVDAALKLPLGV